ncbi:MULTISPECIES: hydantoinase/oxoprolinase family protein [Salinibaculum]|uniref:hydantoinase/oxoprolinase family protein n=1 Tax=Salinibaculum TaxID=2732368 RepID=UPI0030D4202F
MDSGTVRLGVDVGGTFTDVVLVADGEVTTAKVPTTESDQSEGVLAGIAAACEAAGVAPECVDQFRHAMTVSTNAMLEGTGARTALVTTEGFQDVLAIGRQDRPALYDLDATRPDPLVPAERRYEVDERATPDGIERRVDEGEVDDVAAAIADSEAESVAVSFLHAYAHPENERRVAERLRERLDAPVVASHETLAAFREYERTATTVADAYVTPVIDAYLGRLERAAAERDLPAVQVMQSNGGIADTATVRNHGVETVLSGPAAGVVGASLFEDDAHEGIITFDMGGTSSDVSLVRDGDVEETTDADIAGHPVRVPMVDVETVGAGGGSIAHVDAGGALRVGPESAGADPGPACYGKGGDEPTVTDANLVLGYLGADTELGEGLTLDAERARAVIEDLAAKAGLDGAVEAARGIYRVANARMARAIRSVTVERGHDPRAFGLVAFGGAGPMHACALADRLDVETIRVPRANGVLSALGLLAADEHHDTLRTDQFALADADPGAVDEQFDDLAASVLSDASDPEAARVERAADLRYAGQSHELTVAVPDPFDAATVAERFEQAHERTRGYHLDDEPIEVVNLRATATIPGSEPDITHEGSDTEPVAHREAHFTDRAHETTVYDRGRLAPETTVAGPAIFEGGESTVVVPPGWETTVDGRGTLVVEKA